MYTKLDNTLYQGYRLCFLGTTLAASFYCQL